MTERENTLQISEEQLRPAEEKEKVLPLGLALASYPIAYLYVCSFLFGFAALPTWDRFLGSPLREWGQFLFVLCFLLWGSVATGCKANKLCNSMAAKTDAKRFAEEHFWFVCTVLLALVPVLGRGNAIDGWGRWLFGWALHGCAVYWMLCRAGQLTEQSTGAFFFWDLFVGLVVAPFGSIHLRIQTIVERLLEYLRQLRQRNSRLNAKGIALALGVILAALPVLGMVGRLLSVADSAGFARFWNSLTEFLSFRGPVLPDWFFESVIRFCFSLPVGAYLFGLVACCVRRPRPYLDADITRTAAEKLRVTPNIALLVILGLFCAVYAVFFGFQTNYLFGAFFGIVPGDATAAEYAREGFFQLCQVMFINFGLLAVVAKGGKTPIRSQKGLRLLSLLLMAESVLLAVTAASKLGLYILRFGFTPLRLLSAWAVLVLAAGSILAIISILRPFRAIQKWVWFSVASFVLLCLY